jgi:hypothetical protein
VPPVAIARRLWPATLRSFRDLSRLAVTALVLAVGLGGATAATPAGPPAAGQLRPTVVASRVDMVRSHPSTDAERVLDAPAAPARPLPLDIHPTAVTPGAAPVARPVLDPARDAVGRRGPPLA